MPQGKFKLKNRSFIAEKKPKKVSNMRKNCPIAPKKWKYEEGQKIKRLIGKNVNKKIEEEIRALANDAPKTYTAKKKKQIQNFVKSKDTNSNQNNTK